MAAAAAAATPPTEAELKEAEQYWGYMISADRTGTDKFKNLLRGLHSHIGSTFDAYDSSDLTPSQLARFYRSCNGNYDQLFLATPPATVAFIYKNLGCLHSLQPLPISPTDPKYSDPVIPALKIEGWIIWSTIQLLLAPDEHANFLRQAVAKWDIRIPGTSDTFPKVLPRSCFPASPDPTMQGWYDHMTERLRREMEDEETVRIKVSSDDRPDSPMYKHHRLHEKRQSHYSDDGEDSSPDSRNSALAYFRNPLFRTVDGRPGMVRQASKRPGLSPRQSFVSRGKTAAATVGRVVQNVASPHLWDGHTSKSPKDSDHHRRKSLPDKHGHRNDDYAGSSQNSPTGLHPHHHERHARRGSHAADSPPADHTYWNGGNDSPRRTHSHRSHGSPDLHHRRSHDSHPSPREYFPATNYDGEGGGRRNSSSTFLDPRSSINEKSPAQAAGFKPSVSPLFATHVARGEKQTYPYRSESSRPSLQRRTDYKSPERTGSRPNSGREEWEGSDNGCLGRSGSQRHQDRQQHSKFGMPVSGVDGRRYPVPGDTAYRR